MYTAVSNATLMKQCWERVRRSPELVATVTSKPVSFIEQSFFYREHLTGSSSPDS